MAKSKALKPQTYLLSMDDMDSLLRISEGLYEYGFTWDADLPKHRAKAYSIMLTRIVMGATTRSSRKKLTEAQVKEYTAAFHLRVMEELSQLSGKKQTKRALETLAPQYGYSKGSIRTYAAKWRKRVSQRLTEAVPDTLKGEERRKALQSEVDFLSKRDEKPRAQKVKP